MNESWRQIWIRSAQGRGRGLAWLAGSLLLLAPLQGVADDFFEQKIRPVLVEHCFTCHSSAADPLKGALLLDSAEGVARGGSSGIPAVVPGELSQSRLIEAIRYGNPDLQMPPKAPLPAQVVADFESWVERGAAFPAAMAPVDLMARAREHWAFHPPSAQAPPEVADAAWARNEIDRFILAKLESAGLRPAPEADRRTLIRRLSFDLLGLAPTPEEVAAFAQDTAPDAYERLVDRLLASPHYGERWGRHWLDVARYADTKGYVYGDRESVNFTHSHVYRDWVVKSLNDDLPYDAFIRLQIAADKIVTSETRADLAAMGFLTLGPRFLGVMPDIIDDRIDTMTRGLMGLTVSCARCHDHKFDPVPIEDYYSLYGVFSASSGRTELLDPESLADAQYAEFRAGLEERQSKLKERFAQRSAELEARLRAQVDRYIAAIPGVSGLPTDDFYEIRNADDVNPTIVRRWAGYVARQGLEDPVFGIWNRLAGAPESEFRQAAQAVLAAYAPPAPGDAVLASTATESAAVNAAILGPLLEGPPASLAELAARYAAIFKGVNEEWLALTSAAEASGETAPERLADPAREAIRQVMVGAGSPIRVPEGAIVDLEWMFAEAERVELATLQADIDRWIVAASEAPSFAVVLNDKPEITPPRVFLRGSPANAGPEVPRQFPELLSQAPRVPFLEGSGRRELAEAIASAENPLTARVMVNRVWGWHFGAGLVDTPSDFGTRSAPPSHPELLDWLALRFVAQGWSLKQLHREIVCSATYRQQSGIEDARAGEVDPENRLLWRFPPRRLEFELLRDALLQASGELDRTVGGKPVEIASLRRTLYGKVDRQFLPGVFRVFDFPNPDMHSPTRLHTTVPQQALYLMNNPFVQARARAMAARAERVSDAAARVEWMYQQAYQRGPLEAESSRALAFVREAEGLTPPPPPPSAPPAWSYGYGKIDPAGNRLESFTPLPHFTGSAWQGGSAWPDAALGWAQLTAEGGHPGNDLNHAVVRRWTAPVSGTIDIAGRIRHARTEGDGIMARILSSRHGLIGAWFLHNSAADTNFSGIRVEAGDTIDFEVDIKEVLNSDEHLWAPVITMAEGSEKRWNAQAEFAGPYAAPPVPLQPWEKLAQVLLASNELLYVD